MHTDMLRALSLYALMLMLASGALGQGAPVTGWVTHLELGPSFFNHNALNQALDAQDYGPLAQTYFSLGGGFERYTNRWVMGGKIYGYLLDTSFVAGNEASLMYNFLNLHLGFLLTKPGDDLMIYPSVGAGGGIGLLRLEPLGSPIPEKFLSGGGLLDVSLNLHKLSILSEEDNYLLDMGVRVGYLHAFGKGWERTDVSPDRAVSYHPSGVYLRVILGVGQRNKKLDEQGRR